MRPKRLSSQKDRLSINLITRRKSLINASHPIDGSAYCLSVSNDRALWASLIRQKAMKRGQAIALHMATKTRMRPGPSSGEHADTEGHRVQVEFQFGFCLA